MCFRVKSPFVFLSITLLILVLSGCSSLKTTSPDEVIWEEHQKTISAYQQWKLRGRLNIRTEDRSDTVTINWQQTTKEIYLINLSASLGLGAVQIEGSKDGVKIEKAGEPAQFANSLEEVSLGTLDFEFPASQLYFWIRGIPAPGDYNIKLNDSNLLDTLQQDGWQLSYDRYREQDNGFYLPGRIKVERLPYSLTFSINRW